jgi:pyruvate dehydrogenase E1 component beta subunit|tara:strand:- start:495 stop:1508 length:1014 start_codon:yes stop_codon:yes gene_type:complete
MSIKTFRQALNEALHLEMSRDKNVIIFGEDVCGGTGGTGEKDAWGGAFGVTKGLLSEFGPDRIMDTPITESAFVGAAVGAAMTGLRPVTEIMFVDFLGVCFDQIFNQAAKVRYMFGGKADMPMVLRASYGAGASSASQHSQALYPIFTHIPGLKVVVPSNPYDAKGLLINAIRDEDPVIFLEHKMLYDFSGEVPDEAYTVPFGEAGIIREGKDVTLISLGKMVNVCQEAADELAKENVAASILDLRTISPLDEETILEFTEETGRVVVVDEAYPRCGVAADVSSIIVEKAFSDLKAPIKKVTPPHSPVPYAPNLEQAFLPSSQNVIDAVKEVIRGEK